MPLNSKISTEAANAELAALLALLDGGFMDLFDGVQPASVDTPPSGTLLASLSLGSPAYNAPVNGAADLAAPAAGVGIATGSATWLRLYKSDHASPLHDGSVGTSGSNLNLVSALIMSGGAVTIEHYVLTQRKS